MTTVAERLFKRRVPQPAALEASSLLTSAMLIGALADSAATRDAVNQYKNIADIPASIVTLLASQNADPSHTLQAPVDAFVKYHQKALKDEIALFEWQVSKHPGGTRSDVLTACESAFAASIVEATTKGDALWQEKVEKTLRTSPVRQGQEPVFSDVPARVAELGIRRDSANQWLRKTLYDAVSSILDQRESHDATVAANRAAVDAVSYADRMNRLTRWMIGATFVAASAGLLQAIPVWAQWLYPIATQPRTTTAAKSAMDRQSRGLISPIAVSMPGAISNEDWFSTSHRSWAIPPWCVGAVQLDGTALDHRG
jgi:hypothetical protein